MLFIRKSEKENIIEEYFITNITISVLDCELSSHRKNNLEQKRNISFFFKWIIHHQHTSFRTIEDSYIFLPIHWIEFHKILSNNKNYSQHNHPINPPTVESKSLSKISSTNIARLSYSLIYIDKSKAIVTHTNSRHMSRYDVGKPFSVK